VRTALPALFLALLLRAEPKHLPAPLGLDIHLPAPQTNPLTPAKVDAGRRLFFDTRLSRDRTLACASCHEPVRSFSDSRVVARGVGHALGTRNVPTLVNRGYGRTFFWDGRADTLERQVLQPIVSPIELALTEAQPGDVVVLAGRGAEPEQEVATGKIPFDDREVAGEELRTLAGSAARA